ncbi:MAG: hypothetical protein JWP75_3525 [Frondihabitans sp.]|nr:hypothetical protein [Frondihabitans sp.]
MRSLAKAPLNGQHERYLQRMRKILIPAIVLASIALSGCSSATPSAGAPAAAFKTHYGQSAALVASHIKGCKNVTEGSIGNGGESGLVSTATCKVQGMPVQIFEWKDAASMSTIKALLGGDGVETYYAQGTGWSETYGLNGDVPGQKAAAAIVAASLDGRVIHVAG